MELSCLLSLLHEEPGFRRLLQALRADGRQHGVAAPGVARPYLVCVLQRELRLPLLLIASSPEKAKWFYEQAMLWSDREFAPLYFPELDLLSGDQQFSDISVVQQRLQVLSSLVDLRRPPAQSSRIPLIIAPVSAVIRRTIAPEGFVSRYHTLSPGMRIAPLELLGRWNGMGYEIENVVEVPGTASRRGGVVDIYPPNSELPLRLEFVGDEIESIRFFDPRTQRSLRQVDSALIAPAVEVLGATADTILDYLPLETWVVIDEPADIEASVKELRSQIAGLRQEEPEEGESPADLSPSYLAWPELEVKLGEMKRRLTFTEWPSEEQIEPGLPAFLSAPDFGGRIADFLEQSREMQQEGRQVVIVSHQVARLRELLHDENVFPFLMDELDRLPPTGSITLAQGSLAQGWMLGEFVLLTDAEIFGFVKQRRLLKPRPVRRRPFLPDLKAGDYVVHVEHGIARFGGVVRRIVEDTGQDYLVLEYAAGDKLYVSTDQADRVSRYVGSQREPIALSRLGGHEWARVKQRVKESTRDLAEELISLYATREIVSGFAFSPDTLWQQELEASFPYVETPDQMEVVRQVKEDMEKPKPMDRLVCGDVGYGKTEVALRAAFKAVMEGKQVAVLVPTTVLAQQHYLTFSQRLAAFPVKVEVLSRFRSEREQKETLERLVKGNVDICIGTHRLLQKDVVFKDLGLVVVDEEQRFGVANKERLKQMRREVDVLTLSATPIPRTLHMSLVGVRDLSVMETPPDERLPIKTFVGGYNPGLVREAILRELERQGQVFFVHNRVESIGRVAYELRKLVPEAEVDVAHGQMPEDRLEKVMLDFVRRKVDVLLCTTIIESGLDIPAANTLIVNEADRLGLAQLYQLRGRVGRGSSRAYAYFFFSKGKRLTPSAKKRLQTIFEATELGAGFYIAMKDLEIRGAGNLLGSEQSGHIAAVGFDLYCELLSEAVGEVKARMRGEVSPQIPPFPTIDLPLSAYIPEEYVSDPGARVVFYQRLARMKSPDEIEKVGEEFEDRFGKLPGEVENLLYILRIRAVAAQAGVKAIARDGQEIVLSFEEGRTIDPARLAAMSGVSVWRNQVSLDTKRLRGKWQGMLDKLLRIIDGS